jgi:glutamate N-acetyltransferase/amino-acid N-acetyltransferase
MPTAMRWVAGGVTAAQGFRASGVSAGIKRLRKPDLALVAAERPVTAVGVFTRNRVQAVPVVMSRGRLRRGRARAVLINSGCANCLTGSAGLQDARVVSRAVAHELGIAEREVLLASTGIIGRRLPVRRIVRAIPRLVQGLSRAHHAAAAEAIMTTDLQVKEAAVEAVIEGRTCRVGGMAKGAGMIAPSMATMLGVITTDIAVAPVLLRALLQGATERTFNRISVDGEMSTNDTVFVLASGASGVAIRRGAAGHRIVAEMLEMVSRRLAHLIVDDGEGATQMAEIRVVGARTVQDAQACARQVANSPLVKTMLAGGDPNVGRIAAAAGASPARFDPKRLEVFIGDQRVIARGAALRFTRAAFRELLAHPEVRILIHLHAGRAEGRILTCDLTEDYVRLNARYTT